MTRLTLLTLSAAALLLTPACKKDQPNPTPQPTPELTTEQQLAGKTWVITAATVSPGLQTTTGTTVTDLYPFIPACTKDDTQQFMAGGVFRGDEGATKCDATDPQAVSGSWSTAKTGSDTTIDVVINGSTLHFKVLSLSESQLKMSSQDDVFGIGTGTANTYTLTYTKK